MRVWRAVRHGVEHRLGDEAQRALRAHEQAAEDLHRLVGVEERAQPVAGRVLDLELAPDALRQLGVGADLVADRGETVGQLGLPPRSARPRPARRCRSSCPRGARTSASAASSRSRGARRSACRPSCWRSRRRRSRSRSRRGPGPGGARACAARGSRARGPSRLHPHAAPSSSTRKPRKWRRTSTMMPSPALAVEARAAGAERDRRARAAPVGERLGDVAASCAITTTWGIRRYGLASEA